MSSDVNPADAVPPEQSNAAMPLPAHRSAPAFHCAAAHDCAHAPTRPPRPNSPPAQYNECRDNNQASFFQLSTGNHLKFVQKLTAPPASHKDFHRTRRPVGGPLRAAFPGHTHHPAPPARPIARAPITVMTAGSRVRRPPLQNDNPCHKPF
ncbi:hypothetical protein D3C79_922780 [compost metagenome]